MWIWRNTYCAVYIVIFDFISVFPPFFVVVRDAFSIRMTILFNWTEYKPDRFSFISLVFFSSLVAMASSSSGYFATTLVLYVSQWLSLPLLRSLFYIDRVNSLIFKLKVGFLRMPMAQHPNYTRDVWPWRVCARRKLTSVYVVYICGSLVSLQVYPRRWFGVFAVRLNVRWAEAICEVYAAEFEITDIFYCEI